MEKTAKTERRDRKAWPEWKGTWESQVLTVLRGNQEKMQTVCRKMFPLVTVTHIPSSSTLRQSSNLIAPLISFLCGQATPSFSLKEKATVILRISAVPVPAWKSFS